MDDLGVIELLRSNMKEAKEKATDWLNEEDIEGALLVFQVIDVTGAGKNDLSRACYNSVHTEFGYVGAHAIDARNARTPLPELAKGISSDRSPRGRR